jgi:membrane protein implicated in regulation of membrane protease activity
VASLTWLGIAAALLLVELAGADFDGWLVGAVVALLLSILTALVAVPPVVQGVLAAVLAGGGYALLWRWSRRRRGRELPHRESLEQAEVIAAFDGRGHGRVLWHGQSWAAETLEPERPLTTGQTVTVMGREGNRLQVIPR